MRDETRNYAVVGAFVVAMLAALLVWLAVLSGRTGASERYHIVYDSVMGLSTGLQILYQGHPVGLIEGIRLVEEEGRSRYRVDVSVRRGLPIPEDSRALITAPGLLSAVVIDIQAGRSERLLAPGSAIEGVEAVNAVAVLSDVADQVTQFVGQIEPLVESVGRSVPAIVADVGAFTGELEGIAVQVDALLAPENTARVARILGNLEEVSTRVNDVAGDLRQAAARAEGLLSSVAELVDENREELDHAVSDAHEALDALGSRMEAISHNLEATTRNMNEFSRQIRENPGLLLRGRETGEPLEEGS